MLHGSPTVAPHAGRHPMLGDRRRAADLVLLDARAKKRAGCIPEAIELYEQAIATAERTAEQTVLAEALRRVAVLRHQRDDTAHARELCLRAVSTWRSEIQNDLLASEALNTIGGLELATGSLVDARASFVRALELGGACKELGARVEQNLGIVANIQGDLDEAFTRYQHSRS